MKKLTNSITNPISYVFFGLILIRYNKINRFQFLNTLLKINDLLMVNLNSFNEDQKVLIAECFKEELKKLKKLTYDFSLILADTSRSYMYLKNIIKENISVENILYSNKSILN